MKYIYCVLLLALSTSILAKKPEIYRCKQKDGTVVIQDRRCMVTALQQPKSKKPQNQLKRNVQPVQTTQPNFSTQRPSRIGALNSSKRIDRSPFFTFGWDRFIPANWVMQKSSTNKFQQLLLSKTQFSSNNDFNQGVKLSVYSNTMKASRLDSFAQALELYHKIRDDNSLRLLDSQFKNHPNYKVFNIKYQNKRQHLVLTEFYIDEVNNDLFVVTAQATEANWSANWLLAEKIISQL